MYQCPGCGGALKFDIPSQNMKCDQCQNLVDPYSLRIEEGATDTYDATIFTCSHCGGEIISTDNSVTEFCSFCGAHTVLESRLCSIKRPNYIIPFKISKEQCKEIYKKHLGKSFFTPKAYKNTEFIDSFRGIYMPYWAYHVEQQAPVEVPAVHTYRRGDYRITDHYALNFDVDAYYKGLSYDASSSFYDSISEYIGPYQVKNMKEFHPAIMSGFYGDTMDIPSEVYCTDAFEYANEITFDAVNDIPEYRKLRISVPDTVSQCNYTLDTKLASIDSTMYPVWFMSYRNGNRVAYATINGQTGKIVTDLPISKGKYFLCSLLISLPIFLLFTLLFTFTAATTMGVAALLGIISVIIYSNEVKAIAKKDAFADDKGMLYARGRKGTSNTQKQGKNYSRSKTRKNIFVIIIMVFAFFTVGLPLIGAATQNLPIATIASFAALVVSSIFLANASSNCKKHKQPFNPAIHILNIIAFSISLLIGIANPVSDIIYYTAIGIMLIVVVSTNISIINKRNICATRKLPQFNKTGGDNRA